MHKRIYIHTLNAMNTVIIYPGFIGTDTFTSHLEENTLNPFLF